MSGPPKRLAGLFKPDAIIIVVDDEHDVRESMAIFLEYATEREVVRFAAPVLALKEMKARGSKVVLMISDVVFPKGQINGLALAQCIMLDYPHVKILLTSGSLMVQSNPPKGCGFLAKPFNGPALEDAIIALFQNGQPGVIHHEEVGPDVS